jgi:hypothetical protein
VSNVDDFIPAVFTPATLAKRWEVSKTTIVRMIKRGDIPTLDFPLIRISLASIEAIEKRRAARSVGKVYVLESGGLIKIGYSMDPIYRIRSIRATSPVPVSILHQMDGCELDEKNLHKRFSSQRAHGEWFRKEGELAEWIDGGFVP